jgi:hypothetical protein
MTADWLDGLLDYSEKYPLVGLRITDGELDALENSRRGISDFTIARAHQLFKGIRTPAPCVLLTQRNNVGMAYFAIIASKSAVTTLESRVRISRAMLIEPSSEEDMAALIVDPPHRSTFLERLRTSEEIIPFTPKLSRQLISKLVSIGHNRKVFRIIASALQKPRRFGTIESLQADGVRTAMAAFGLSGDHRASEIEIFAPTALLRVPMTEDAAIEHDARWMPGLALVKSDVTGRALFEKDGETLEVYTANRRELEHCLGVDLIYFNLTKKASVLIQYKMLEAQRQSGSTDWIYRPDGKLEDELSRMRKLDRDFSAASGEYRLNPTALYLKFVKRDAAIRNGTIVIPLDHFDVLVSSSAALGPKGGLRISYDALKGSYLRQTAFLELVRSGYIGSYAQGTEHIRRIVESILAGNRAVIAAFHSKLQVSS